MRVALAYVLMISLTVLANLLLKLGATEKGASGNILIDLLNWRVVGGLTSFALAAFIYVVVLSRVPLNVAQSFLSLQFVAVIIASALFLGEPIGPLRWLGIALIVSGILVVG